MRIILALIIPLLMINITLASLNDYLNTVQNYVNDYESKELNIAELIIYLEDAKINMYETMGEEGKRTFSEDEIMREFGTLENPKIEYITNNFKLVIDADYFLTEEYYASETEEIPYVISYYFEPLEGVSGADLETAVNTLINKIKTTNITNISNEEFEELRNELAEISFAVSNIQDCQTTLNSIMTFQDENRDGKTYSTKIKEKQSERCHPEQNCTQVCEEVQDCWDECHMEEVCQEGDCQMERACEEVCNTYEECHPECEQIQVCEEYTSDELFLKGFCDNEGGGSIWIEANGMEFEEYNQLNNYNFDEIYCQKRIDGLIKIRKKLQESVNNDFVKWCFEEYLSENVEKMMHGDTGFRRVMNLITWIEEEIAQRNYCWETESWPEGFEKIEVDYESETVKVKIWEKMVPVEWMGERGGRAWTTLYNYSWFPSREELKQIITYGLNKNSLGPSSDELAGIKTDPNQLEVIERLSAGYGGSLDIKFELIEEGEAIITKYLTINTEDILMFKNDLNNNAVEDISISINYYSLYDFINYMRMLGEEKINGPNWVDVQGEEFDFGQVLGVIGAISKFWREGVNIMPRYALFNLMFTVFDMVDFAQQITTMQTAQGGVSE